MIAQGGACGAICARMVAVGARIAFSPAGTASAFPRGPAGAGAFCEGAAPPVHPSGASRQTWLLLPVFLFLPRVGGAPGGLFARGLTPPLRSPMWEHSSHALRVEGAPPLRPRVTFPTRGKSPKARQGLRPLESPKGDASLPLRRCRHPLDRVSATNPDRFATLGWWANRSLFLPKLHRGSHFLLSIRGSAGLPSRMLEGLSYCNQYR